jgi:DNA-binding SARP family transcriptional activator/TolB-like protein
MAADTLCPHENGPAARLSIGVIGGLTLEVGGVPLPLANRRARAILAFLALEEQRSVSRERLAGLFWPEVSDRQARGSLRQALTDLRQALEALGCAVLPESRDELRLARDLVDLDLTLAFTSLARGEMLPGLAEGTERLLVGCEDLSPEFDAWLAQFRRATLERLLRRLEGGYGDDRLVSAQRRRMAELALRLDPLHEAACRVAMELAALDGDIAAALRCYGALYRAMDRELDMEPSEVTQALNARIKRGDIAPPPTAALPKLPPVTSGLVLPGPSFPGHALNAGILAGAPVVAVLPFRCLGPDPVPPSLSEGVVDDIVGILSSVREPVVISGNSTRHYAGVAVDLAEVSQRLGASYLVCGSLRSAGVQLRLNVELLAGQSGAVLWWGNYDIADATSFAVHQEIATKIAFTLVPRMQQAELQLSRRRPPESLTAYQLLQQARAEMFRLTRASLRDAQLLLERAVRLDPDYAPIHLGLANCFSLRLGQRWSIDRPLDILSLQTSVQRAVDADPTNGAALAMLGHSHAINSDRFAEARALIDRATAYAPNDAETLMWGVLALAYAGDPKQGILRGERAIALSPEDPFRFRYEHFLSGANYTRGDFDAAAEWGSRSMARNPFYLSNLCMTAAAYAAANRAREAREVAAKVLEVEPGFAVLERLSGFPGRDEQARRTYAEHLIAAGLPA